MQTILALCALVIGAIELRMVMNIFKKHNTPCPDIAALMARAPLVDVFKVRWHTVNWIMLWNLSGALAWMP